MAENETISIILYNYNNILYNYMNKGLRSQKMFPEKKLIGEKHRMGWGYFQGI